MVEYIKRIENILKKTINLFSILELLNCYYLLNVLPMKFDVSEKCALYFITIISSSFFLNIKMWIKKYVLKDKKSIIYFIIFNIYLAFSFSGNSLFLYPINGNLTVDKFILFILTILWISPIIVCIMIIIEHISKSIDKDNIPQKKSNLKIFLLLFTIVMIVSLINVLAFNPAILSYDSLYQISQAKGIDELINWHPPIVTLLIRFLLNIIDSPSFLAIIQSAFYSAISAYFMTFLYSRGLKLLYAVILQIIFACMPNNFSYSITIWKDIPYNIAILWLTLMFSKIISNFDDYKDKNMFYFEMIFPLTIISLFRQNGIVVYIIAVITFLYLMKLNYKSIVVVIITVITIGLVNGPLYSALDVKPAPVGGKYIGLAQDIIGVYYAEGNLSSKGEELVKTITNVPNYTYSPYWSYSSYDLDMKTSEFICIYVDTFIRNPGTVIKCVLCRVDAAWNLKTGNDGFVNCVWYTSDKSGYEKFDSIYPERKVNCLTTVLDYIGKKSTEGIQFNYFWRGGIHMMIIIICCYLAIIRKKIKILVVLVPIFAQVLSLLLSTAWMDYRYFWGIALISYYFLIFFVIEKRKI